MFGFFCRQFSIAVCDGAVWPSPLPTQAISLLLPLMPKPLRKPLCRSAPTDEPACSSSIAIVTRLALRRRAGVLPDQDAGVEVVGREQRIGGALRGGRRVERDHEHARLTRLRDRGVLSLAVGDRDQDPLHSLQWSCSRSPRSGRRCRSCSCRPRTSDPRRASSPELALPAFILTKNGFVTSFVIRPTLTLAVFDPVVADAAATMAAVPPTRTRNASVSRNVRRLRTRSRTSMRMTHACSLHLPPVAGGGLVTDNTF